jgi:hypothetical protein
MRLNKTKLFLAILLTTLFQSINAQGISSQQLKKEVKTFLTDSTSGDYVKDAVNILQTNEENLNEQQYKLLYYMQGAKPEKIFPSLTLETDRFKLQRLVNNRSFKKAISIGETLANENPVDLTTLVLLSMSIDMSGGGKENKYYKRMRNIITAILKTGDGKTPETAIKIVNINDDDQLLGFVGFNGSTKQDEQINGKYFSVWKNRSGDKFYFEYVLIFL